MQESTKVSIVVPSFNQAPFIRETLQSLVDQQIPNLEVIIQDGGSTDGADAIAREFVERYPETFQLFVEKDSGQANALNRGFARTTGEILGFLNSDDTLFAGCLKSVIREIDPKRQRWIVFGRCVFTGEGSDMVGVEHPAEFVSHFDQLAIWKRGFNLLPQPSVFWHRKVWEKCGGFDESEHHALDYDLFCRFSRHFRFHKVDELWSTYRLHEQSKSSQRTEQEVLELSIAVSRKNWGPWWSPTRWRCAVSHWYHNRRLHERARHYARLCEQASSTGKRAAAFAHFLRTLVCSPRMAWHRLITPFMTRHSLGWLVRLFWDETGFTGQYADRWIGPLYRHETMIPANATRVVVVLEHRPQGGTHHPEINSSLVVNRKVVETRKMTEPGQFFMSGDLTALRGKTCRIEIKTPEYFLPCVVHGTPDERQLSVLLHELNIETQD